MSSMRSNNIHQPRIFKPAAAVSTQQSEWECWASHQVEGGSTHNVGTQPVPVSWRNCCTYLRPAGAEGRRSLALCSGPSHCDECGPAVGIDTHERDLAVCTSPDHQNAELCDSLLAQADPPHRPPACAPPQGSCSAGLQAPVSWTCGAAWRDPHICQPAPAAISAGCDATAEGVRVNVGRAMLCSTLRWRFFFLITVS